MPEIRQFVSSGGIRIYRIPCKVLADLTARVYLVLEAGEPTLVDVGSGQGESTKNILDGFDTVRREFDESIRIEDVERILITHGHVDHYGGLPDVLQHTQAEVCIHPLDSRLSTASVECVTLVRRNVRRLLQQAGVPPDVAAGLLEQHWQLPGEFPTLRVNVERLEEDEVGGLRVLHTPGHSPGHVCLVADDLLLCGDHILSRTIPQLWPESIRPYKGLGHYLESLHKVRGLSGIRLALPGHEAIIEDVPKRIDEINRSERRRINHIVEVLAEAGEPMTMWEIAGAIYQQTAGFYASLAFMDTAARVEYLHQRGRLHLANLEAIEAEPQAAWQYQTP